VDASLRGIDSHGILRVPRYCTELKTGLTLPQVRGSVLCLRAINSRPCSSGALRYYDAPQEVPTPIIDTASMAVVDGRRAFGQICARDAMALAIRKAKETGIGVVTVRESNRRRAPTTRADARAVLIMSEPAADN
jgi:LDH2 family malate/lactate/ureidoglycolate dehydrogenase